MITFSEDRIKYRCHIYVSWIDRWIKAFCFFVAMIDVYLPYSDQGPIWLLRRLERNLLMLDVVYILQMLSQSYLVKT